MPPPPVRTACAASPGHGAEVPQHREQRAEEHQRAKQRSREHARRVRQRRDDGRTSAGPSVASAPVHQPVEQRHQPQRRQQGARDGADRVDDFARQRPADSAPRTRTSAPAWRARAPHRRHLRRRQIVAPQRQADSDEQHQRRQLRDRDDSMKRVPCLTPRTLIAARPPTTAVMNAMRPTGASSAGTYRRHQP